MEQTTTVLPHPRTDEEILAEIDRLLAATEQTSRETRAMQAEIDRRQERAKVELDELEKRLGL